MTSHPNLGFYNGAQHRYLLKRKQENLKVFNYSSYIVWALEDPAVQYKDIEICNAF